VKNIAKGAWLGAGAGFVATVASLTATSGKEDSDRFLWTVWLPVVGAGVGGGSLEYSGKNKKQELIYSF